MESSSEGEQALLNTHPLFVIFFRLFSFDSITALSFLLILILISGLVSGAEVALFSIGKSDLDNEKDTTALQRVKLLLAKPRYLLATILITNNLVNIAIVILSYYLISFLFDFSNAPVLGFFVEVVAATFIILVFGEIIPKLIAVRDSIKIAKRLSYLITLLSKLLYPFSYVLVGISKLVEKRLATPGNKAISIEEIDHAIEIAVDPKASSREKNILKGILRFGNITVKQVMKGRLDIIAIGKNTSFKEVLSIIRKSGYSRIPVFNEDIDHVVGIIYAKDVLKFLKEEDDFDWSNLIRPPFFVPEAKKLEGLLKDFQTKRTHLAIVVDEFGGTSGIITLEDVLEEIVGEIKDEFDDQVEIDYKKLDANNYVFEGKTLINDVCKVLNIKVDSFNGVKGDADSLGGLILEIAQKIPDTKEQIKYKNYIFTILEVNDKRILKVKITILSKVTHENGQENQKELSEES